MRYLVLALLVLAVLSHQAAAEELWGCCVPPYGDCFSGAAYDSQVAFQSACAAAGDEENGAVIRGEGSMATCSSFTECTLGCCCAGPEVFDAPTINSEEDLLRITQAACSYKQDFDFIQLPPGSTCVSVCGGTPPPPPPGTGDTYTVRGTVVNGSAPLANAEAFIPVAGSQISAMTDASGAFLLTDVPSITTRVFAAYPSCRPGQSPPFVVDQDITGVEVAVDCAFTGCAHDPPEFAEAPAVVRGTSDITFTLSINNACGDFVQYEPLRCDDQFQGCVSLPPTDTPVVTDSGVAPNTTYCYKARARFGDGTFSESGQSTGACVTTGDAACMQDTEPSWCGTDGTLAAILTCDEQNHLTTAPCEASQMCTVRAGTPQCVPAPPCDTCNGLLGFFSRLFGSLELPGDLFTTTCEQACVLDGQYAGKPLMLDAYSSCLAVTDCAQYATQAACTADTCGITGCSWNGFNDELGQGICVSADNPPCRACDDIFGTCTRNLCHAISDGGYFDGERNGLAAAQGCIPRAEMACRYYDTQADCTGTGGNAIYDVQYEDGARIGTTNARTTDSADILGIGACSWGAACYKDADMSGGLEDDCIENERYFTDQSCVKDSTPPVTTLFLSDPPVYSRAAVRTLPYQVTDDTSPLDLITTYVCFDCDYPQDTFSTIALPEEGQHELAYYSEDANGNLEQVQRVTIIVNDAAEPAIEQITVEEES